VPNDDLGRLVVNYSPPDDTHRPRPGASAPNRPPEPGAGARGRPQAVATPTAFTPRCPATAPRGTTTIALHATDARATKRQATGGKKVDPYNNPGPVGTTRRPLRTASPASAAPPPSNISSVASPHGSSTFSAAAQCSAAAIPRGPSNVDAT